MKLKKGSAAARAYMAKIRAKRKISGTRKEKTLFDDRQTGGTNKKYDAVKKAKAPGKRTSATGKQYTERRANRSDRPGTLLGTGGAISSNTSVINLNNVGTELLRLEYKIQFFTQVAKNQNKTEKAETLKRKKLLTAQFKALKVYLNTRAKFI